MATIRGRRESEGRTVNLAPAVEPERPTNRFTAFIDENREDFLEYTIVTREYRNVKRTLRTEITPIVQSTIDKLSLIPGANTRRLGQVARDFENLAMGPRIETDEPNNGHASSPTEIASSGISGMTRNGLTVQEIMAEANAAAITFNRHYNDTIENSSDRHLRLWDVLSNKTLRFMLSNYQAMVDMLDFLSAANNGADKTDVFAYYRDFVRTDNHARKSGNGNSNECSSFTAHVKLEWQDRLDASVEPAIFGKFWEEVNTKPAKFESLIEPIAFGILLDTAVRTKLDGFPIINPEALEIIGEMIAKTPLEAWPKQLKDAYMSFVNGNLTKLIDDIRCKLQQNFPDSIERTVEVIVVDGNGSSKKRVTGPDVTVPLLGDAQPEPAKETETPHQLKFGLLKAYPNGSRDTHRIVPVDECDIDSQIADLASVGSTPDMVKDLKELLYRLRNSSVARDTLITRQLKSGNEVTISQKTHLLRRLDPRQVRDISLADPKTRAARIVYVEIDETVLISGVYPTHQAYEKAIV
jgi:hypothetical protein